MSAIFIGRFQPFHKGHLAAIKWILEREKQIFIVIGSNQETLSKQNPFSFSERREMIKRALLAEKIKNFKIYGIPDFSDDIFWAKKILKMTKLNPKKATVFTRNPWTKECFKKIGGKVKPHPIFFNKLSSTKIREIICKKSKWKDLPRSEISLLRGLVPKEVLNYLKEIGFENRFP